MQAILTKKHPTKKYFPKPCSICGKTFIPTGGRQTHCSLECEKERGRQRYQKDKSKKLKYQKEHYQKNRERIIAYQHEYSEQNKEKIRARKRAYRLAHIDHIKEKGKEYYWENRDECLKYHREYHKKHAEVIRDRANKWRVENPDRRSESHRRRRARKRGNGHAKYTEAEMLMQWDGTCGICGKPIPKEWLIPKRIGKKVHVDHIIPLDKDGTDTLDNVHFTHAECNLTKHAKLPGRECFPILGMRKAYGVLQHSLPLTFDVATPQVIHK